MSEQLRPDNLQKIPLRVYESITAYGYEDLLLQRPEVVTLFEHIDSSRPIVYPASPYGFAESTMPFLEQYIQNLENSGFPKGNILNPWSMTAKEEFDAVGKIEDAVEKHYALFALNKRVGMRNALAIAASDVVTAGLDGQDIDSGTSSEVGFAAALKKPVFAYRTDFRQAGDNAASRVNLQVEFFAQMNNGKFSFGVEKHWADIESFLQHWNTKNAEELQP